MINKNEIPVLFTPDENFMMQTCVAILSMQRNKNKDTFYHYYLLVSTEIRKDSFRYLKYLSMADESICYSITYFSTAEIDKQKIFTPHITSSTYYRLFAADFYDFDKCIYNDGDIIVNADLTDMYNIEMKDEYVAGVKSIVQQQGEQRDVEMIEKWGFPTMNQYIVAGNLVLNLKRIREDGLVRKFDVEMKKGYPQQDQDVLNYCCYNHIIFLKLKYGIFNRWMYTQDLYKFKHQIFEKEEIEEALQSPSIVHFAGGIVKPWLNTRVSYASKWWNYAKELLPEEEYSFWRKNAEEQTSQRDWFNILENVRQHNNGEIYIFGCAWVGQLLLSWFRNNAIQVRGFVDNNPDLHGICVDGITVFPLSDVLKGTEATFIISSQKAYREIFAQLIEQNVAEDNIIIYRHDKNDLYFQSLAPEYRNFEYHDLMAREIGESAYKMSTEELKTKDMKNLWEKIWR